MSSRRSFTIKEKAEIISRLKNGESNAAMCKEFKVPHSSISSIWKNREIILECSASTSSKMKKNRKSAHQDIEKALLDWAKAQKREMVNITGPMLQEKANYFAKQFGKMNFKCSEGWVYRFRRRYNIMGGKIARETSGALQNDSDNRPKLKLQDATTCHEIEDTTKEMFSDSESLINNEAEVVTNQCCFCGDSENDSFDVTDKPYVESNKIKLILNDFDLEMDFNKDSISKSICSNCDTILNEIYEFVKLVKKVQDKFNVKQLDDVSVFDIQYEGASSMSCNPSGYDDDDGNLANEDSKQIINTQAKTDRQLEKDIDFAFSKKHYKLKTSPLRKKCRDDRHKIIDDTDPLAMTDKKNINKVLCNEILGVTDSMMDNNLTIQVKEEIAEMADDIAPNQIESTSTTKVRQLEVNDRASTSNMYKAASRISSVGNRRITEETSSDTSVDLRNTSETVGEMSKSDLILLIQSVVCQMLNK